MKEIKAVINPGRLPRLREAFRHFANFPGMTVMRAEGAGNHPNKPMSQGIKGELTDFTKKIRIEIVAQDHEVAAMVAVIREICHTGQTGDGVVWVTPVDSFLRLRE